MEDKVITTPSGYTVTIKPYLTFGEKRQLQRVYAKQAVFNSETKNFETNGTAVYDVEDATVSVFIKSIVDSSGNNITGDNPLKVILGWKDEDAQMVYDAVDEADKAKALPVDEEKKQNLNLPSSNSTVTAEA